MTDAPPLRAALVAVPIAMLLLLFQPKIAAADDFGPPASRETAHTNQDHLIWKLKERRRRQSSPLWWSHTNQDGIDPPEDPNHLPAEPLAPEDRIEGIASDPELAGSNAFADSWLAPPAPRTPDTSLQPMQAIPAPGVLLPGVLTLMIGSGRRRRRST